MKGKTLLWIAFVLICVAVLVPRAIKSESADAVGLLGVPGIICFIIGVLRARREKEAA